MEAIVLAGGRAERLAAVTEGRPKALVPVAGRPLLAYQLGLLARYGIDRVIVSCAAGQEAVFLEHLTGLGPEVVCAAEPEPLGRGGGIRFAARARRESGPVVALNGDELLAVDLRAMVAHNDALGAAATIAVTRMVSSLGVVDLRDEWVT
ncbi:MAG: sugar phosphate nucleotidyltransferase, partial [Actinomycetota bacterium]